MTGLPFSWALEPHTGTLLVLMRKHPPVMSSFLSNAVKRGALTVQEFPELARGCIGRGGKDNLLESCISLESDGLDLESFLGSIKDLWTLQLSRFFLWRYLGEFSKQPVGNNSAYRTLAAYIKNRRNNVPGMISLNYDTLCESALALEGIEIDYSLAQDGLRGLLYLNYGEEAVVTLSVGLVSQGG